mmetsp:Transcript_8437/g.15266  ORF Transcript_8437/g.15266 Transcript_8437/m.15266 type:complete len:186 (-) Transcript_8437:1808-2365(-)
MWRDREDGSMSTSGSRYQRRATSLINLRRNDGGIQTPVNNNSSSCQQQHAKNSDGRDDETSNRMVGFMPMRRKSNSMHQLGFRGQSHPRARSRSFKSISSFGSLADAEVVGTPRTTTFGYDNFENADGNQDFRVLEVQWVRDTTKAKKHEKRKNMLTGNTSAQSLLQKLVVSRKHDTEKVEAAPI